MKESSANVLLIEDDVDVADAVIAFFRQKDIAVIHMADPALALKKISDLKIDVVITDLKLPNMSGIEFLKNLRELGSQIPVILITASSTVDTAVECIEAGAYDFVVKPLQFQQLNISVHRALRMNQMSHDNSVLKRAVEVSRGLNPGGVIGFSPAFRKVFDLAKRVSQSVATIFISGESGSGKEVFAKAIHQWGPRKDKPFVAINCSAIPDNLLESELFGHAKGAFTGAIDKKIGLFEEAEGGTIFLDEIGDMNISLQTKLLRVIQERQIKRVGENQNRDINVRIITATHKNLKHEVLEKRFREDLFFRLNVIPIHIPPLRERREDILPLANFFLKKFNATNGKNFKGFTTDANEFLIKNPWPGNVRELENTIERAVVLCSGKEIDVDSFLVFENSTADKESQNQNPTDGFFVQTSEKLLPLEEIENKYIGYVFEKSEHVRELTAKTLGIDRKTLYKRLQTIHLQPRDQGL